MSATGTLSHPPPTLSTHRTAVVVEPLDMAAPRLAGRASADEIADRGRARWARRLVGEVRGGGEMLGVMSVQCEGFSCVVGAVYERIGVGQEAVNKDSSVWR
jgi:hypothetical protein